MGGEIKVIRVRGGRVVTGKMARAEPSLPEGGCESLPGRGSGGAAAGRVRGAGRGLRPLPQGGEVAGSAAASLPSGGCGGPVLPCGEGM